MIRRENMKKLIATLLSLSLILACAGCSKEEETTKKKKKKTSKTEKTESTEDPTDDPTEPDDSTTEKPTEDTDPSESESSTSEDTSSSSTVSPLPTSFSYNHELLPLDIEMNREYYAYGVEDPNSDEYYGKVVRVGMDYEYFWFIADSDELYDLESALDEIIFDLEDKYDSKYDELVEQFTASVAKGEYPEYDKTFISRTDITRADSLILSFYVTETSEEENAKATVTTYNYISPTVETISFDDVVTDRAALHDYVATLGDSDLAFNKDQVLAQIEDGTIPFCLSYDGIVLVIPTDISSQNVKVSAIGHEDMFNMVYFGSTPDSFMFKAAPDDKIFWDIDGDNVTDEITFTYPDDMYNYPAEITFDINGKSTTISGDQVSELEGLFEEAYLAYLDETYYIIVRTTIEDGYSLQFLFRIGSDLSVEYLDHVDGFFFTEPYTPEYISLADSSQFIGTGLRYDEYYLDPTSKKIERTSPISMRYGSPLVTKKDIVATDPVDNSEATLPAGTTVRLYAVDIEEHIAYFEILHEDPWDSGFFTLSFTEGEYRYVLDAGEEGDLFSGLFYAG